MVDQLTQVFFPDEIGRVETTPKRYLPTKVSECNLVVWISGEFFQLAFESHTLSLVYACERAILHRCVLSDSFRMHLSESGLQGTRTCPKTAVETSRFDACLFLSRILRT